MSCERCKTLEEHIIAIHERANRAEAALRDVLAEYEYQVGPFEEGHEPDVIRTAHRLLGSMRTE